MGKVIMSVLVDEFYGIRESSTQDIQLMTINRNYIVNYTDSLYPMLF